ncbi:hypothetical protein [Halorussus halophilus]|uniref:hypothetical protein n=1 Tax=Halorussus halophilus TaxID=2650975 RepID=UPI00130174F9|nr:hypothetical protein [Halorussus halophilus]
MAVLDLIVGFVVSLLIGAFGIYVGASVIADIQDYEYAIITALVGSLVWWLVSGLVSFVLPFGGVIGSLLALVAWVYIVNARYPGGWANAVGIGLVAYLTTWVVLYALSIFGVIHTSALGVPGL